MRIPAAVEETLRWVSPVKNMARTVTEETELGGVAVPAGDQVLMLYPSANRDAAVFDDPFTVDIARSPNEHGAFGSGLAPLLLVLGASLALREVRVILEEVLDRLPDLALASPEEARTPPRQPRRRLRPSPRHRNPEPDPRYV